MIYIAKDKTGRITDDVTWEDLGDTQEDNFYISKFRIDGNEYLSRVPKNNSNNINKKRWKTDLSNMKNCGFEIGECI